MAWGLSTPTTPTTSPSGSSWGLNPTPTTQPGGSFGLSDTPGTNVALTRQNLSGQVKASQAAAKSATNPFNIVKSAIPSLSDLKNGMVGAGNDIIGAFKSAFSSAPPEDALAQAPGKVVNAALKPIVDGLIDTGNNIINGVGGLFDTHKSLLEKGADLVTAGTGVVQATISPLMSLGNAAINLGQHVPAIAPLATGINGVFAAIGQGSKDLAITTLNNLPISQDAKDKLAEPIGNAAALAGQLIIGKGGADLIGKFGSSVKDTAHGFANTLKGAQAATEVGPVKTISPTGESTEIQVPFANKYTPENQLPVIQTGPKAPETLPVAAKSPASPGLPQIPGLKYEPVANEVTPTTEPVKSPESPVTEIQPKTSLPQKGGEITKAASDINATIVKQGFEALTPEEQSRYTEGSYKDSVSKVATMMDNNVDAVKEMARTGKGIPNDVHPQILFNAVEALATKEGDYETLSNLAKSPLGTKLSEAGATIGSHGYNDNPNSVVSRLREVNNEKQAFIEKKGVDLSKEKTKDAKIANEEVKKAATAGRQNWDQFIESITCKI